MYNRPRIGGNVKDGDVVCKQGAYKRDREEHEWQLAEGLPINQTSGARLDDWATECCRACCECHKQADEGDAANGPWEPDSRLKLAEHDGEDDSSDTGSNGSYADGNGALCGEACRDDCQSWDVRDAAAHPDTEALGK